LLVAYLTPMGGAQAQSTQAKPPANARAHRARPVLVPNPPQNRPWAIGVSQAQQRQAEALYQTGNRLFKNSLFAAATAKYREALQHWDHPGIHYNLALALISLDRPLEAYESIVASLKYGTDALDSDEYRRALDYQRLLRHKIAEVEVVCDEPGAAVTLDGKTLFTGPGRVTTLVMPGKHQIVASKAKYITSSKAFTLAAAVRTRVDLHLVLEHQTTIQVRRWPSWTHWTVTGVGLGFTAVAATLHRRFDVNADELAAALNASCTAGCETYPDQLIPLRQRLERQRNLAHAGYATAGVFLAAGALLTYLNRPRLVENRALHDIVRISLAPGGPEGSPGVSIHVPF
jgi:hypothetical protein